METKGTTKDCMLVENVPIRGLSYFFPQLVVNIWGAHKEFKDSVQKQGCIAKLNAEVSKKIEEPPERIEV